MNTDTKKPTAAAMRAEKALRDGFKGLLPGICRLDLATIIDAEIRPLLEALIVSQECGDPDQISLYDEEGIEGWQWLHPDGREWAETGSWDEPAPMHPWARAAIAKARS